jgi:hypothetical protein
MPRGSGPKFLASYLISTALPALLLVYTTFFLSGPLQQSSSTGDMRDSDSQHVAYLCT